MVTVVQDSEYTRKPLKGKHVNFLLHEFISLSVSHRYETGAATMESSVDVP